jgi:hypothetical protein
MIVPVVIADTWRLAHVTGPHVHNVYWQDVRYCVPLAGPVGFRSSGEADSGVPTPI